MLAKIKVYDSSSELQDDLDTIQEGCSGNQSCVLLSNETEGKGSAAYLVTADGTHGYFGRKIDSSKDVPVMAIIPRGDDSYRIDSNGCPTEVEPYSGIEQVHTFKDGSVQYYTEGRTRKGVDARDALLEKEIFAGSIPDLLNYLGMHESSETEQVLSKTGIDIVR